MTTQKVSQSGVEVLSRVTPDALVGQAGIEVLYRVDTPIFVAQAGIEVLHRVIPTTTITQAGVEYLHKSAPCTTRWAQAWTIERTDGEVFRFTSLDRNLEYPPNSGIEYQACDSLVPSASESVSELDAAGNMDLSGAIGPAGITEHALYSGLFDGAEAEAWLVPWSGAGRQHRLLKGTFAPVEQNGRGFKVELLGDGGKLLQTPLVSRLQPGCRWKAARYGGFGGSFCGKDITGLTVTGTVDSATGQRSFVDAARAEAAGYFTQGRVTFTSGDNIGISAEIKEHSTGGNFELWPRLPYGVSVGDTYSMIPGCTYLKASDGGCNGCTAWDNELRYGGFDKVPTGDKRGAGAKVRT